MRFIVRLLTNIPADFKKDLLCFLTVKWHSFSVNKTYITKKKRLVDNNVTHPLYMTFLTFSQHLVISTKPSFM